MTYDTNSDRERLQGGKKAGYVESGRERYDKQPGRHIGWKQNWLEVATRLCGVDDGLPAGMDGFKLSKAGHRVARSKGLGNAIVPQVVMEIMKAIKAVSNDPD
jgi:hypothetical protein